MDLVSQARQTPAWDDTTPPPGYQSQSHAESIHDVDPRAVEIVTALDSLVAKLARVPDAPVPVLPYSANVTWSVLCPDNPHQPSVRHITGRRTYRVSLSLQTFQPAAITFEPSTVFWKTTRA